MSRRRSRGLRCVCGFVFDLLGSLQSRTAERCSSTPSIVVSNLARGPVQVSGNASSCRYKLASSESMKMNDLLYEVAEHALKSLRSCIVDSWS